MDVQSNKLLGIASRPMSTAWTGVPPTSMCPGTHSGTNELWVLEPFLGASDKIECGLEAYLIQLIGMNDSQINPIAYYDPTES
ncbi:hypothetical protein BV22DRAFT_1132346 [Leucogyrophana mollusca]|uniref:Uncharacterized protein n=1 Tax=Leucogyrophana mollusca TaxID=85980 RepID=A0ACB8B6E2_9AGAM|nr:hypothetical protein BV22DRAFT_1132346 [Leucogyrophana mollusca]